MVFPRITDSERDQIQRAARANLAREHLMDFARLTFPKYRPAEHLYKLTDMLERVENGEIKRLLVSLPPRHGKSEMVSIRFPAWYLGRNPDYRITVCSYVMDLAQRFSRQVRNVVSSPVYSDVFGVSLAKESRAAEQWDLAGHRGGFKATGVGGALTGFGANCFPAGTMVTTEWGEVDIADLVYSKKRPRVLAFDHATGQTRWCQIEAVQERSSHDLYEVYTSGGRSFRVTGNHPIYVEGYGYKPASLLSRGDRLVADQIAPQQTLCNLWRGKEWTRSFLRGLLSAGALRHSDPRLRLVQAGVWSPALRVRKVSSQTVSHLLLFSCLPRRPQRRAQRSTVPLLRTAYAGYDGSEILYPGMQAGRYGSAAGTEATAKNATFMSFVWDAVHSAYEQAAVLPGVLRRYCSFRADAGRGQRSLQDRDQLRTVVYRDAPSDLRAGPASVRCVPCAGGMEGVTLAWKTGDADQSTRTPYQRGCDRQYPGESGDLVSAVPHDPSQVGTDSVAVVRRVCTGEVPVYDIQVEGCHNFFAEHLLVHNCLIIDDPIKDRFEAERSRVRDDLWDWYTSTAYTRLQDSNSAVIVCNTRWHEDDLTGRLLRAMETDPGADKWVHLHLPALSDDDEPLWPQQFPKKKLYQIRTTIGPRDWEALYQGRPRPAEGALFKEAWLEKTVDPHQLPTNLVWKRYWDLAISTKASADYMASAKVAFGEDGTLYIADMIRRRLEWPDARKLIIETCLAEPTVEVGVEKVAFQAAAIQELLREPQLAATAIRGIALTRADGDKEIRAKAWSHRAEAGKVVLVKGASIPQADAAWIDDFVTECLSFPVGLHDDQVDAVSGGVQMLASGGLVVVSAPVKVGLPLDGQPFGSDATATHHGYHPLHPSSPNVHPVQQDAAGRFIPPANLWSKATSMLQRLTPAPAPVFSETPEIVERSPEEARMQVARHLGHILDGSDANGAGMRQALREMRIAVSLTDENRARGANLLYMALLGPPPFGWTDAEKDAYARATRAVNDSTSDPWTAERILVEAGLLNTQEMLTSWAEARASLKERLLQSIGLSPENKAA